jgi:hypothetical protein
MRHEYTAAKHAAAFSGTFECRFCGLDAPAVVHARGSGTAQGHGAGSAQRALADAEADANSVAARTLTFYPCPKCGKVDPSSGSFRVQVIVGSLVIGGLIAVAMYFLIRPDRYRDNSTEQTVAMVIGGIVALACYLWWGRAWWNVKRRVQVDMASATFTPRDAD